MDKVNICWFRRDLRLSDQAALFHALQTGHPVVPLFIFDKNILDDLDARADARVEFIHHALGEMQAQLVKMGSSLEVYYGYPEEVFASLLEKYPVAAVFCNQDYEPYARTRDQAIERLLATRGLTMHSFKDQVIFEKLEVCKDDGNPYTVFTPYSRKWKSLLTPAHLKAFPTEKFFKHFYPQAPRPIPSLASMGFFPSGLPFPSQGWKRELITHYHETRDFPALAGTSRLGVHLRFGTLSIRELARETARRNEVFFNELIWREFYQMILWNFPRVGSGGSFKPEYDLIRWRNNEKEFESWCAGMTGYPIVDAGMRELNATGYMHNRVRMITASFLTKHLLVDWRWGEAYFAKKLLDYDFAANNGGWQWASGSGCDAAPYFRIFSPQRQTEKFDKDLKYIRRWVPELEEFSYPRQLVDHELARKRCLETYGEVLKKAPFRG